MPRLVPAPCLRRACDMRATKGTRQCPPPHTPPPPQGWGMKEGRGGQRPPPPPRTKRQGGEAAERGCGTDHTTVPEGSTRRASPSGGGTGGANAGLEGQRREPHGKPPPPLQRDKCRTSCLRRACDVLTPEDGQRGRPPPPPHPLLPHPPRKGVRTARRWRAEMGGGQRTDRRARGRDGRRAVETKKKNNEQSKPTRQGKKGRRQGPKPRRTGGGRGDMGLQGTLAKNPTMYPS